MSIGPVQLIVLGFPVPNFHGEITAELERLRERDTVRVVDALAVHKGRRRGRRGGPLQQPDRRGGSSSAV
jgi:hypothetical protein